MGPRLYTHMRDVTEYPRTRFRADERMVSPCSSHNTMAAKETHAQPRAQPVQPHQKQEQSIEQVAGAPRPAFCITERWIRERLNLQMSSLGILYMIL